MTARDPYDALVERLALIVGARTQLEFEHVENVARDIARVRRITVPEARRRVDAAAALPPREENHDER